MRTMLKKVEEVRFMIEDSFENLNVDSIRFIGHGNDCDAYEINGSMIFKFPNIDWDEVEQYLNNMLENL